MTSLKSQRLRPPQYRTSHDCLEYSIHLVLRPRCGQQPFLLFCSSAVHKVLSVVLQAHTAEYHAKSPDIQHLKELQQTVEQAESQLEVCVEALSLLTLRAGKSEQLMTSMQVLLIQTVVKC